MVKAFLKPLRERKAARTVAGKLNVPAATAGPKTFHAWLSAKPGKDRHRPIQKSRRILDGVAKWPLGWLKKRGAVCYERAAGRVAAERGGRPDSAFMKGVVRVQELATLTANASDHYLILTPGKEPRFMTVGDTMRAFVSGWRSATGKDSGGATEMAATEMVATEMAAAEMAAAEMARWRRRRWRRRRWRRRR